MRFFTADTHFGHINERGGIIKMMSRVGPDGKLFSSTEEHDQHLIDQINNLVNKDDELIVAGDFAWTTPGKYRSKIECRHIRLIRGNHDKPQINTNIFGEIPDIIRCKAYNDKGNDFIKLFISHYPHAFWDGSHKGWGHLYGHIHGMREEDLDFLFPQRRSLDIGVDNIYKLWGYYGPVSEIEIYNYMAKRSGHDDVRFYEDYRNELFRKIRF